MINEGFTYYSNHAFQNGGSGHLGFLKTDHDPYYDVIIDFILCVPKNNIKNKAENTSYLI